MSDQTLLFKETGAWKRIASLAAKGLFPQCISFCAPEVFHSSIAREAAELVLCAAGHGGDDCPSCAAWTENGEHPDMIRGGEPGKPPSVDACRDIIRTMALRPAVSKKRCAIIFSADNMLLPAANSLLKLAEEPPGYGYILLMLSDAERLLPTLKSRSWPVLLDVTQDSGKCAPPSTEEQWSKWAEKYSGSEPEDITAQFGPWIRFLIDAGEYEPAGRVESVRLILEKKRLSRTMSLDFTVMALKEGIVFEHLFGNIW